MKKYIKWIIGLAILVLVVIGIVVIRRNGSAVSVEKIEVKNTVVRKTVSASGVVKAENQVDLAFPTTGTLEEISVDEGDSVTRGQLIAYIQNTDTQQAAQAAKKTLDAAEKDLDIYKENYSSNPDAVGGEDEYYLNIKKLQDLVQKAEANYNSTLAAHSKTLLYAPFDAEVIDVYKNEYEVVAIGETIIKLANLDKEFFEISVDQEDFGLVKVDQKAEISLDSYEDKVFDGQVSKFTKYIDEETKDFIVEIAINEADKEKILLGMEGDTNIVVEKTEVEVPALVFDQVYSSNGDSYVWVVEKGTIKKFPVKVGLEGDIYTQIKTDLSDKTLVMPIESTDIKEGKKADIVR